MINYEFPLNEKIRKFLRIEELFQKMDMQIKTNHKFHDYTMFEIIFNLMATASRSDLKVELIQELEKQFIKISKKRNTEANKKIINEIKKIKVSLEKNQLQPGYFFGDDRLIQEIKSRSDSPFGILSVDFPAFKYWLENEKKLFRQNYFKKRLEPFLVIKDAINMILMLLRKDLVLQSVKTNKGFFQIKLNPLTKSDLVTVSLSFGSKIIPDVSSNKYAINIQFADTKNKKIDKEIKFKFGITAF